MTRAEYQRAWRAENSDRMRAAQARYIERHPDRVKRAKREWKKRNSERVNAARSAHRRKVRAANPDAVRAKARERYRKWRLKNPVRRTRMPKEKRLAKAREYARVKRKRAPAAARLQDRAKYQANAKKLRAANRARRTALPDCYVAQVLGLSVREAPPILIKAKREHLRLQRKLRNPHAQG